MTYEEFCKIKFYTKEYVVIPLKNNRIVCPKSAFCNPKLRRKDKYDKKREEKWLKKQYDELIR